MSNKEYKILSQKMLELQHKYSKYISIALWEENSSKKILKNLSETGLSCGAGLTEWTITEQGFIKPCSFFPDKYFTQYFYKNFQDILLKKKTNSAVECIISWEKELNSVGLSTKNICEVIYRAI
ncbi:hypothetical protein [Granulicatella sp. zg-84]|uniref:hypothetical protein n=1 Tax=Granulicatella sp. zg-84 TaxID=2678503 RepID=UPI0013C13E98|nr:hypothetical protein [Granulicatella sp. zg-84]NEW66371.1 hypothetical protein [Granulicatella sp. zg-84]